MEKQRLNKETEEWINKAIENNYSADDIIKLLLQNGYEKDKILDILTVYDEKKSSGNSLPSLNQFPKLPTFQQQQFPSFPDVGQSMENIAKTMNQGMGSMPRVIIPTSGDKPNFPQLPQYPQQPYPYPQHSQNSLFNPEEQKQVNKIKKWAFIVSVSIVVIAAGYGVLMAVLK